MDSKGIIETIRSCVSGIHIQGQDFSRIDEGIGVIASQLKFNICEWNQGYGWVDFEKKRPLKPDSEVSLYEDLKLMSDDDPAEKIYIIKNAYVTLKNDDRAVARLQQELLRIRYYFPGKSVIFLVSKEDIAFSEIKDLIVSFPCPPLAANQVDQILNEFLDKESITVNTAVKTNLTSIFSGMERELVFRILQTLKNRYKTSFPKEASNDALRLKKNGLSQSGLLELVDSAINIDQIGGLGQLKSWLRGKKYIIDDLPGAEFLGISAPKGVLLAGMPGCGKSMSAKATASLFNAPLFRLDIGTLMGKYVGESEANMKAALKLAEQASPCILWIDELEKAFSGINGSGGSTEITTRLFGYFLTWMQEKPGAVFVIATANDITTIPPELLRRGRFDEIFYIDLPCERERQQIFKVKAKGLKVASEKINFGALAKETKGFSGADIECVINDALEHLFRNKKSVLTQDVLKKHIDLITPISVVLKEKITSYQEIFEKFSLKAASFSDKDIERLDSNCDSSDSSERENAASNELISNDKLMKLVKDDNSSVRMAALKNPQCPIEALEDVVHRYKPFDFNTSGSWSETQVAKEEFHIAMQHPNMNGYIILDLYRRKVIDDNTLLSLACKLSSEDRKDTFNSAKVKLSRKILSATVQKVRCRSGDVIKSEDILIEIDTDEGRAQRVSPGVVGFVNKVCIKVGDTIHAGQDIAHILVTKNKGW